MTFKNMIITATIGAALGTMLCLAVATEFGWLYTTSAFDRALYAQRINSLAEVCDALGEQEWAEQHKDFKKLRGWGNYKLREDIAEKILTDMAIDKDLIDDLRTECATRLSAA